MLFPFLGQMKHFLSGRQSLIWHSHGEGFQGGAHFFEESSDCPLYDSCTMRRPGIAIHFTLDKTHFLLAKGTEFKSLIKVMNYSFSLIDIKDEVDWTEEL